MITYDRFLEIGLRLQKINKRSLDLYQNYQIDLINYEEDYEYVIDSLLREVFTEEQYEWFSWFCWDNDFGQKGLEAYDANKNLICQSWEQLYDCLKQIDKDTQ